MTADTEHGTWTKAIIWSTPHPIPSDSPAIHVLYWVSRRETFEANEAVRSMRGRTAWVKSEKSASLIIRDALVELTDAGWIMPVAERLFVVHPLAKEIGDPPKAKRRRRGESAATSAIKGAPAPTLGLGGERAHGEDGGTGASATKSAPTLAPGRAREGAPKSPPGAPQRPATGSGGPRGSQRSGKAGATAHSGSQALHDSRGGAVEAVRELFATQADMICMKLAVRATPSISEVIGDLERFRVEVFGEFEAAWSELVTDVITAAKTREAGRLKDRTRR